MTQTPISSEVADDASGAVVAPDYTLDTRPLCQGMPFVLTDAAHPRLVLKHGSHFLVMDQSALIPGCNTLGYGYYRYDTRHISQWDITMNGAPLSLLSSSVNEGYAGQFLYTNPHTEQTLQQKITIQREVILGDLLWERLTLQNFHATPLDAELKISFSSDFADMFEVRGLNLEKRGQRMLPVPGKNGRTLFLGYRGLDGELLETVIEFYGIQPDQITADGEVTFKLNLPVHQIKEIQICVSTRWGGQAGAPDVRKTGYSDARRVADERYREWCNRSTMISTGHQLFDMAVERAFRDLYILRQPTPKGYGLSAGVPWYCALFGRDSAITAWQVLPFLPDLAKECIEVLGAYQGTVVDEYRAEAPGRILHELRIGEMARTNQIPHSPYYGTVDATQLWLFVLGEYVEWSGDLEFAAKMWPAAKAALDWIDASLTETGYLVYKRESEKGLENQGWKDSGDSVMHVNGQLANPPIALCEVQGYLYAAWESMARIAALLGHKEIAEKLTLNAAALKERFERDFWMEDERFVALALDSENKQVGVVSSNPGHLLFTGVLSEEKANHVADRLMSTELQSGWGIRTLSKSTIAYNPMSYHNGSIWPHDNAIIAEGMRKIGRVADAHKIMLGLLEAAQFQPDFRLPELFCGFERDGSYRPIDYPVSCSPQAWAAGAIFQLLKTCVNFQPDACHNLLRVVEPSLPEWLDKFTVQGLRVGSAVVGLSFTNYNGRGACQVLNKSGKVRVVIES
ncbi:amylo-alpha-1,6-glucosidase [soil metagenome]